MKFVKLFFSAFVLIVFVSCSDDHIDDPIEPITLNMLLNDYDLWYINHDNTTGSGGVSFVENAFTLSFLNGIMYANNNLVDIGNTGNGLGIRIGYYDTFDMTLETDHDLDGIGDFVVTQLNNSTIELYNRFENVTYYLEGYQVNTFNYDQLFNDNITLFLQEYELWEKTYVSDTGDLNEFDNENFLRFPFEFSDTFESSIDTIGTNFADVIWDFIGGYDVSIDPRVLTLDYDIGDTEKFNIDVINDEVIELYHISSGTTYQFTGVGYIQFKKNSSRKKEKRRDKETVSNREKKRTKVERRIKIGEKYLK